jgi:hypothetical protein
MKYNLIALACAVLLAAGLSLTVTAGPTEPDTDSDGVVDQHDNCSAFANSNQADSDQDGYGQVCDGDFTLNNNHLVNLFDFASFKNAFVTNPYDEQCDHTCNGIINLFDFASFKNLFVGAPGPSGQTCAGPKGNCAGNPGCP